MHDTSRTVATLLLGGALALGASACAPAQAEELRIGFLAPKHRHLHRSSASTCATASRCIWTSTRACSAAAKVKFIVEDTQGKPDTAVAKANKLILQDKVHMLVGGVLATTGYALAPVADAEKMLYIGSIATADDLGAAQVDKYPYMVRPTWVPSQPNHPLGQWACDQGYKKVVTIAADYAFGYETAGRLPADLRGLRRQGHPEDLAADRHQGLRTLYPDASRAMPTPSSR